jgi:hypothetical protein
MKKLMLLIIAMILVFPLFSQENEREYRTILDGNNLKISGMGGPFMQFTSVAGEFGHMMGGGGGVLLNNFFFGGYGLGLTNRIPADANQMDNDDNLVLGHGGFWIGYSLFGHLPVHVSVSSLIGFGELGLLQADTYLYNVHDQIFVLTPIVEVEANITQYLRIGAGATYNLYTGVNIEGYSSKDFSSPGVFLGFKFGWF